MNDDTIPAAGFPGGFLEEAFREAATVPDGRAAAECVDRPGEPAIAIGDPGEPANVRRPRGAPRRGGSVGLAALGVVFLIAAAGLLGGLFSYKDTAKADAASLRDQLARKVAAAAHASSCTAPPPSAATPAGEPRMLLAAPEIGLNAPVLEGTDDKALDTGVGHVGDSKWPDQGGTTVLAAHNATFFVRLPDLKPGDTLTLTAPCRQWVYKVSSQQVVTNTASVSTGADQKLVLVTCWPIDALFNTADRYLLTADLLSVNNNTAKSTAAPPVAGTTPSWKATLPSGLAGSDLSDRATGVATGRLITAGSPSSAWQSSPASLNAVGPAVQLFGGTIRAARTDHAEWWATLAPGLPRTAIAPLLDAAASITFRSPLDVTVTVAGDTLARVDLTTSARIGTGTYRIDASAAPQGNRMSISAWKMTLTRGTPPTSRAKATSAPAKTSAAPARSSGPSGAPAIIPTPSGGTSQSWTPAPTTSSSPVDASPAGSSPSPAAVASASAMSEG